ncbi:ParB/RepB/Spo0J family partition protein [Candidatus Kaiserbacteria bacterium]|nr:MAG: ParB/RepB/Spo0J family partition protein [Candidatus Kaiserbacteria bacterium]
MAYESNSIFWIEVEKVVPNPFQPRREFDQAKLQELSESIRMYGVLQPLVVTRHEIIGEDGAFTTEYELIAGERRLRASKLAGLSQVPVIIRTGEESQLMKLELAIIENLQREDLNAVDRALAFKQLSEQFGLSHMLVAKKVGRSREYVANSIRLLMLPETILGALRQGDISDGHARTLLMLNDRPTEQDVVFREILIKKLSVREVERISRKIATEKVRKKNWQDSDPELIEIEKQFTETFGTRVQIQKTDFGGKLTIDYFASDDLRKLLEVIHKAETNVYGGTATKMLAHIESATPLAATIPHIAEPLERADMPASPTYEEDVFTRYDSIETPETSEAVLHAEELQAEQGDFGVVEEVLEKVSEAQDMPVVASTPIPTPTYSSYAPAPVTSHVPEEVTPRVPEYRAYTPTPSVVAPAPIVTADIAPTPTPEPVAEPEVVQTPVQPEPVVDDTDLYAIKNFSL